VAVLRHQRGGAESRSRAQDRSDIVRIGHLIEHHQGPRRIAIEHVVKEDILQRIAFQHQPLMRRIARDQPAKVGGLGIFDREILGQFTIERGDPFAGCPQLAVLTLGVLERRLDRVAAPQPDCAGARPARAASALHPPGATAHRLALAAFALAAHRIIP
jgi:hypothetical protein